MGGTQAPETDILHINGNIHHLYVWLPDHDETGRWFFLHYFSVPGYSVSGRICLPGVLQFPKHEEAIEKDENLPRTPSSSLAGYHGGPAEESLVFFLKRS